jgi:hypothetical protein
MTNWTITMLKTLIIATVLLPTLAFARHPKNGWCPAGWRAERNLWNISATVTALLGLDVGSPNHFAPFLGFVGDELAKIGEREREHVPTQVGKPGNRSSGQKNKCPRALNLNGSPCG